jgi:hypothetical protein
MIIERFVRALWPEGSPSSRSTVPADEKFYAFTTGGSDRRGKLLYSKDEMEQKDWTVHISLGS